jgi:hypothetical protein
MEQTKFNYFQYRKAHGYPVFVRFQQQEKTPKFVHLLNELGFAELTDNESRKIPLQKAHTRILTIQEASPRLQLQINGSDLLDQYGLESISLQGTMPVYTYRKVGMMGVPQKHALWELALLPESTQTDHMVGLRIMLVRYVSQALAEQGVISYWGTIKDDTVLVMKQLNSFGEAVFIDMEQKCIFSNGGEIRLSSNLKIIRKDKEVRSSAVMSREELISFLSVSTCLLSFNGITPSMRKAIYELSMKATATYSSIESQPNL